MGIGVMYVVCSELEGYFIPRYCDLYCCHISYLAVP